MYSVNRQEFKVLTRLVVSLVKLLKGDCAAAALIEKWARLQPDAPAIKFEDQVLTYAELNRLVNRVANHFRAIGVKEGDVVAVNMENCPEFLALISGLNKIGAAASLINTHLRHKPLAHALEICHPRWTVVSESLVPAVEEVLGDIDIDRESILVWDGEAPPGYQERDLGEAVATTSDSPPPNPRKAKFDDHVLNIYTSGTTGLPKAARVSNRRIFFSGYALGYSLSEYGPGDVIYAPLPLYHSLAMFVAWGSTLATGAAIAIRRRFSASEFWKDAKKFDATSSIFIGEMPRYLMAQPPGPQDRDHKVRKVITVGLRANVWEEFRNRFGIEKVFEFYGATETNVGVMNVEGRPGMLGRLMPLQAYVVRYNKEAEVIERDGNGRVVPCEPGEEGMLIGRISKLFNLLGFDGYLSDDETQNKIIKGAFRSWDEFFVTGDVVKLHDDRWVSFVDRSGDTFRWRGENVATQEVEVVLDACPLVSDVNVYGVKVPGEEGAAGMAAIVMEGDWDCESVSRYVGDNLPFYACPLFVRVCKELPMTSTLKHIKYQLRKDGFDPARIKDPLFFWDRHQKTYRPLDQGLYQDILDGKIKL